MSDCPAGNEIRTGISIGADVIKIDVAGKLNRGAPVNECDPFGGLRGRQIIKQQMFRPCGKRLIQLFAGTNFNLNGPAESRERRQAPLSLRRQR